LGGLCQAIVALPSPAAAAEQPAHPTEAAAENPSPLTWKNDLALWTAIVFVLLLLVLWKYAWGPIAQGLEKREQQISKQIAQAEQSNQQARRLLAQYQQTLDSAGDEVRGLLEQARRDAEKAAQEIVARAKAETIAERQRAVRQIEAATGAALKELAERGATLAVALAGKIVRARLNPRDHAQLIEEAVSHFTAENKN
jgi:F-type H+-transporting ATPase subunit b